MEGLPRTLALLAAIVALSSAAQVTLTATPATIAPTMSGGLVLHCALGGPGGNGGLVGRAIPSAGQTLSHLVSLVIQRNGADLASVSQFSPAHALMDPSTTTATGNMSSATAGYLTVEVSAPGEDQAGNYTCEANGIDGGGHNVVLAGHVGVGYRAGSLQDIIAALHKQEASLNDLEMQHQQLMAQNQALSSQLAAGVGNTHFESGVVKCGNSGTDWHRGLTSRTRRVQVTFNSTYTRAPLVHLGVRKVNYRYSPPSSGHHAQYASSYLDYEVQAILLSETDFTVYCRIPLQTSYTVLDLDVDWLSVPQ